MLCLKVFVLFQQFILKKCDCHRDKLLTPLGYVGEVGGGCQLGGDCVVKDDKLITTQRSAPGPYAKWPPPLVCTLTYLYDPQ